MKIAIASDDGTTIAPHFGRTRGFIIYHIEGNEIKEREYLDNDFTGHTRGMEGMSHHMDRHGPILEALQGCQTVISMGMGRRIYEDLRINGIESYIVDEINADTALQLYLDNKLINNSDKSCEH